MSETLPSTNSPSVTLPSKGRQLVSVIVASVAFLVSCYLAWSSLTGDSIAGCGDGAVFNCNHVLQSRFAKVLGIPISVPAATTLAAIITMLIYHGAADSWWNKIRRVALPLAVAAAATSAFWFLWLQVFQIGKLCAFCLTVHVCNLVLAALIFSVPNNWTRPLQRIAPGILAAVLVAAVQWYSPEPKTFELSDQPVSEEFEELDMDF